MVTLSSCMIWPKISFILPPNEYGCVETSLGLRSTYKVRLDLGGYLNPHAYIVKPTHPKRVTVWCGYWSRDLIGPFFFDNEQGDAVTINGERYRVMLNEFFHKNWRGGYLQHLVSIERLYVPHSRCFAPQSWCYLVTSELRFDTVWLLFVVFEAHIISLRADVVWQPRSCDLTPLR